MSNVIRLQQIRPNFYRSLSSLTIENYRTNTSIELFSTTQLKDYYCSAQCRGAISCYVRPILQVACESIYFVDLTITAHACGRGEIVVKLASLGNYIQIELTVYVSATRGSTKQLSVLELPSSVNFNAVNQDLSKVESEFRDLRTRDCFKSDSNESEFPDNLAQKQSKFKQTYLPQNHFSEANRANSQLQNPYSNPKILQEVAQKTDYSQVSNATSSLNLRYAPPHNFHNTNQLIEATKHRKVAAFGTLKAFDQEIGLRRNNAEDFKEQIDEYYAQQKIREQERLERQKIDSQAIDRDLQLRQKFGGYQGFYQKNDVPKQMDNLNQQQMNDQGKFGGNNQFSATEQRFTDMPLQDGYQLPPQMQQTIQFSQQQMRNGVNIQPMQTTQETFSQLNNYQNPGEQEQILKNCQQQPSNLQDQQQKSIIQQPKCYQKEAITAGYPINTGHLLQFQEQMITSNNIEFNQNTQVPQQNLAQTAPAFIGGQEIDEQTSAYVSYPMYQTAKQYVTTSRTPVYVDLTNPSQVAMLASGNSSLHSQQVLSSNLTEEELSGANIQSEVDSNEVTAKNMNPNGSHRHHSKFAYNARLPIPPSIRDYVQSSYIETGLTYSGIQH